MCPCVGAFPWVWSCALLPVWVWMRAPVGVVARAIIYVDVCWVHGCVPVCTCIEICDVSVACACSCALAIVPGVSWVVVLILRVCLCVVVCCVWDCVCAIVCDCHARDLLFARMWACSLLRLLRGRLRVWLCVRLICVDAFCGVCGGKCTIGCVCAFP